MRKILIIALAVLFVSQVKAQHKANFDYNISKKITRTDNRGEWMSVFVQGDVNTIKQTALSLQAKIKYTAGDIVAMEIQVGKIATLITTEGVQRLESRPAHNVTLNDTMRVNNNINEIHQGLSPLTQPYTGKNVVMGFIDTGIDYLHPDFLDTAGKTRIAFIWDHSLPANSNTPAPYTYGQEFTAADIDGSACTQVAADGHGTYVAGVGAGNGLATGTNKGVAPDADIIMVKYDFSSSAPGRIADAVAYIFAKAALMGKPCVINASLGDYYGSHDGRDLEAQAIKNLITTQPGQLMVGAIGNFGNRPYHLGYTATSDTNFTWFKFDNALGSFIPGLGVYIQAWGDSADMKNIQFSIGADANKATYSYVGNTAYKFIPAILNQSFYDTLKNAQGQRVGIIERFLSKQSNTYSMEFYIFPDSTSYLWRLNATGNGRFDLWDLLYTNYQTGMENSGLPSSAINPEIVNYVLPDTLMTNVSSFACLDEVITVGDYLNRNSHRNCQDSLVSLVGFSPKGSIISNSSHGPTRDNRTKPEVCASGSYNMAAFPLAYFAANATSNKNLKGCYHYGSGGSSFAAPVVAGIGALFLEKNPQLTAAQFRQYIICAAKTDTSTGLALPDNTWGYGKVNGFNTLLMCGVGIIENIAANYYVTVFPNPFSNFTQIKIGGLNENDFMQLQVMDVTGKILINQSRKAINTNELFTVSKNNLSAGIYFYKVVIDGGRIFTGKLVVE